MFNKLANIAGDILSASSGNNRTAAGSVNSETWAVRTVVPLCYVG